MRCDSSPHGCGRDVIGARASAIGEITGISGCSDRMMIACLYWRVRHVIIHYRRRAMKRPSLDIMRSNAVSLSRRIVSS